MLLSKRTGLSHWHKAVKAGNFAPWDGPANCVLVLFHFLTFSNLVLTLLLLCLPLLPAFLITSPEDHCLNCVAFLHFLHAWHLLNPPCTSVVPILIKVTAVSSPQPPNPAEATLSPFNLISPGARVILIRNRCDLATPRLETSLWLVTSHGRVTTVFIHDPGPRYWLMLSPSCLR